MKQALAAMLAVASCTAIAQPLPDPPPRAIFSLADALLAAQALAPAAEAAQAGVQAAEAGVRVAAQRPNPTIGAEIENVGGSRAYDAIEAPKQTVTVSLPVELGGKRAARVAVADAEGARARIDRAIVAADLRLAITQAYTQALAAGRRLAGARELAALAADGLHAAQIRVRAGRASPLEEQRAQMLLARADLAVEQAQRLSAAAKAALSLRIGRRVDEPLDEGWFGQIAAATRPAAAPAETLAVAAARADVDAAAARTRLARTQRVPDVMLSTGVRRLTPNNDVAAVFGISIPLPLLSSGIAAVDHATAERRRADARQRAAELDTAEAVTRAQADLDNAAAAASAATGPTLAVAQEAARIARIGYQEGKLGQLDLLDAERSLAALRIEAIDALSAYHEARARLDRLTATREETR